MFFIIFSLLILFHLLIGIYDFSFFRIPNILLAMLLVLYAFYAPLYLELHAILAALITTAFILVASFGLFGFKIIGAGDAKYITVASLWFGGRNSVTFLLYVSLVGGGLSLIYLSFKDSLGRLSDRVWQKIQNLEEKWPQLQNVWIGSMAGAEKGKRENISNRMIPFGVAIAVGSIIMLWAKPLMH